MENQLIIYPEFDERIERDYLYRVSVTQGARTETLPVYNHTEDSRVNRNPIDGRRADEFRRFSTFAFAWTFGSDVIFTTTRSCLRGSASVTVSRMGLSRFIWIVPTIL